MNTIEKKLGSLEYLIAQFNSEKLQQMARNDARLMTAEVYEAIVRELKERGYSI